MEYTEIAVRYLYSGLAQHKMAVRLFYRLHMTERHICFPSLNILCIKKTLIPKLNYSDNDTIHHRGPSIYDGPWLFARHCVDMFPLDVVHLFTLITTWIYQSDASCILQVSRGVSHWYATSSYPMVNKHIEHA